MTTEAPTSNDAPTSGEVPNEQIDTARVRSFVGLVIARLGPRAYGVVSGTFLALLVASHTESLFAVTFALTAHRLLSWAIYPMIGRWSDSAHSAIGRRLPYMAAGLAVMGICTLLYPEARGYWALLGLIVVARQARVAYSLPNIAATPEVFGRSRWIRAAIAVGLGGLVVGISVRVTVIATWRREDPTTWAPAFRLAAGFMLLGALALLVLVREAPAAKNLEPAPRRPWLDQMRELLRTPNARVLAITVFLGIAASGATDRVYPVYAERVLGASGGELAMSSFVAGPLSGIFGIPLGLLMATHLTRRQIAIIAPLGGAVGSLAHAFLVTELWQSIAIGIVSTPLLVGAVVAFLPFGASLIPGSGGMGERLGVLLGPVGLVGVVASYASALTFDHLVHDYRVIWVFSAVLTGSMVVLVRLRVPEGHERADIRMMLRDGREVLARRTQQKTSLFGGQVTASDADTTDFMESLRRLARRYGYDDGEADEAAAGAAAPTGTVP